MSLKPILLDTNMGYLLEPLTPRVQKVPAGNRLYGVEFEVENVTDFPTALSSYGLTMHADASLRNHGCEFVTKPLEINYILDRIRTFYSLKKHYRWCSSARTSTHIHANVSNLSIKEFRNILAVYVLTEQLLWEFVGKARRNNIFCVPVADAPEHLVGFASFMRTGMIQHIIRTSRYSSLNLMALTKFGTIEFRHAPMWSTEEPALIWAELINKIMSSTIPVEESLNLSRADYRQYIYTVFGRKLIDSAFYDRQIAAEIQDDVDDLVWEYLVVPCTYKATSSVPSLAEVSWERLDELPIVGELTNAQLLEAPLSEATNITPEEINTMRVLDANEEGEF